jgi:acetyl-CoA C-acetyltransferase
MANSSTPEHLIPVIVGVGEIVDRPKEIADGLEPLTLLEQACKRAEADSGAKLLHELGSLDVVSFLSWRYRDPREAACAAARRDACALLLRPGRRREPDPLSA